MDDDHPSWRLVLPPPPPPPPSPPQVSNNTTTTTVTNAKKDKVIVIMGATGTGKSRLSIDLATRFCPCEIVNSDKMQVYKGLDITTNKIAFHDRREVPHHFLGEFDTDEVGELSPSEFRERAELTISDIISRKRTPFHVGWSNSFVYSLLVEEYDPDSDVFNGLVNSKNWKT
ncbi:hypothetical protein Dsin_024950 [Dipteronia sinensis]|uniref:Uncharacterized protein n=1 Tax=Dipteronia sinensis TaxID=43782 RepID=A0AAD9ZUP5_9ROSI|nr:hypothetical protein Dsin_024950 [Dipteronia sinensis]